MKKDQVQVGNTYSAKVSGGIAHVRITDERWVGDKHMGWKGVNTQTGRAVTIKSAQRLRAEVGQAGATANPSPDVGPTGEGAPEVVGAAGSPKPPARAATGGDKAGTKAAPKGQAKGAKPSKAPKAEGKKAAAPKEPKPLKNGPMSGLDAAFKVLLESKKPMSCKEIVAAAFTKKYWRSEGATPEATVYAAIIREISAKGGDARFKKANRGLFAAAGKGA